MLHGTIDEIKESPVGGDPVIAERQFAILDRTNLALGAYKGDLR